MVNCRDGRMDADALDAMLVRHSDWTTIHLYDALRVPQWSLLLFTGAHPPSETTAALAHLGHEVARRHGQWVRPHVIATHDAPLDGSVWDGSFLLDCEQLAHTTYGIGGPVYLSGSPRLVRRLLGASEALLSYLARLAA